MPDDVRPDWLELYGEIDDDSIVCDAGLCMCAFGLHYDEATGRCMHSAEMEALSRLNAIEREEMGTPGAHWSRAETMAEAEGTNAVKINVVMRLAFVAMAVAGVIAGVGLLRRNCKRAEEDNDQYRQLPSNAAYLITG
jgi:hypothetical protein